MRQIISTAVVAVIVGALAGATMSAVAQTEPAAERAISPAAGINAAKVDGKSAVGYTNKKGVRKNKLVATNNKGELPPNIVRPFWGYLKNKPGILADDQIAWGEIVGIPAGFSDGVDNAGGNYLTSTHACNNPISGGGEYLSFQNLPRGALYDFQLVATGNSTWLYIERQEVQNNPDGTLDIDLLIDDLGAGGTGTCNVRMITYPDNISLASARQAMNAVEVIGRGPKYKK